MILDPNKAHCHDMMSTHMLSAKICRDSICKPLGLVFRAFLEHGVFPQNWKKSSAVPVHRNMTNNQ